MWAGERLHAIFRFDKDGKGDIRENESVERGEFFGICFEQRWVDEDFFSLCEWRDWFDGSDVVNDERFNLFLSLGAAIY